MSCLAYDGNGTTGIHEVLPEVSSAASVWIMGISWFCCISSILNCFKCPAPTGQLCLLKKPTAYWPAHWLTIQLFIASVPMTISFTRAESITSWCQWFMNEHNLLSALWFWIPWSLSVVLLSWLVLRRCFHLRHLRTVVHEYEEGLPPSVPRIQGSASRRALHICCRVFCPVPSCAVNVHQKCSPVQFFSNVRFGEAKGQVLDIWRQKVPSTDENASNPLSAGLAANSAETEQRPVLVVVHGGAWLRGSKRFTDPGVASAFTFAHEGWVCVCVNYRKTPHGWPVHALDVVDALQWVHANIASYGGDPKQVVLMGRSAGGHIVAEIATLQAKLQHDVGSAGGAGSADGVDCAPELVKAVKALRVRPAGIVLYYPVLNLNLDSPSMHWPCSCSCCGRCSAKRGQHMMRWFWHLCIAADAGQAMPSPIDKVSAALCPVLLIHGAADCLVPLETSEDFFQRLQKARSSASVATTGDSKPPPKGANPPGTVPDEIIEVLGGCHSFDQVLDDSILLLIDHTLLWSEACRVNSNSSTDSSNDVNDD